MGSESANRAVDLLVTIYLHGAAVATCEDAGCGRLLEASFFVRQGPYLGRFPRQGSAVQMGCFWLASACFNSAIVSAALATCRCAIARLSREVRV